MWGSVFGFWRSWGLGLRVQGLPFRNQEFGNYGAKIRVQGTGFRVQSSGFRVQGSGFRVQGAGCRVQGSGCKVKGAGFRVQGAGFRVQGSGPRDVPRGKGRSRQISCTSLECHDGPLGEFLNRELYR